MTISLPTACPSPLLTLQRLSEMIGSRLRIQELLPATLLLLTVASGPAQAAALPGPSWETGTYRNLFTENGYPQVQVTAKLQNAYRSLFEGDSANERVYYKVGQTMGYILDVGNGDVRSEGQSYGMMIAVQMDKKDVFDRLWTFAKTHMQHTQERADRGEQGSKGMLGFFAWQINVPQFTMKDRGNAPDGEVYFVTSLLMAARRWGNGTGIYNYQAEAEFILKEMADKPIQEYRTYFPMIDSATKLIVFGTRYETNAAFTDPSYHLPSFARLWAKWTPKGDYWNQVADSSVSYLKRGTHPVTGLATEYQYFTGAPYQASWNTKSSHFAMDSWRVAMNIALDHAWFQPDPWHATQSERMLSFFDKQGDYMQYYTQDGKVLTGENYPANEALKTMNATAALALPVGSPLGKKFVDDLWTVEPPTGKWRYYNGMLYMLGMLACSGEYRIWGADVPTSVAERIQRQVATPRSIRGVFRPDGRRIQLTNSIGSLGGVSSTSTDGMEIRISP